MCAVAILVSHYVPLIPTSLDATASFQSPVAVLHSAYVPSLGRAIELQLESLMVRDLILVSCYIHT
jgi:hypothetical protein